ncbi:hypothetical protein OROMI_021121 [Orobanche minor]
MSSSMSSYGHVNGDTSHDYHEIEFHGDIISVTVTKSPEIVDDWIDKVKKENSNEHTLGLDCEWVPNEIKHGERNPVAVIQVNVGQMCLIYQVGLAQKVPLSLKEFIESTSHSFAGVGIDNDVNGLEEDWKVKVGNTLELKNMAYDIMGLDKSMGLKTLAAAVLGKSLEKPKDVSRSDWGRERLTRKQVEYAGLDAFGSEKAY